MDVLNELRELDAWLDGREDIDNEGGPNDAMRVRQALAELTPAIDELARAEAHYRQECATYRRKMDALIQEISQADDDGRSFINVDIIYEIITGEPA